MCIRLLPLYKVVCGNCLCLSDVLFDCCCCDIDIDFGCYNLGVSCDNYCCFDKAKCCYFEDADGQYHVIIIVVGIK